jgi:asparagine synthetase B (glutamine-hydrolysing)
MPLGVISGGFDSSLIASITRILKEKGEKLHTFLLV